LNRIGIVVGMQAEAERVSAAWRERTRDRQPQILVSAADPRRAYEGAKSLIEEGAEALLSFGLAGGLTPTLETGDIVVGSAVILPDGRRLETHPAWRKDLAAALKDRSRMAIGPIAGQDRAIVTRTAKAALRLRTGAIAVDMESHSTATAAEEAGKPFMAVRVILDPASRKIPHAALAGLGPDGESRALPVLARLILRPWELPALFALGRANKRALAVLGGLAADLAPGFVLGMELR
jgi:adenosylhomocysteine nucleosidase